MLNWNKMTKKKQQKKPSHFIIYYHDLSLGLQLLSRIFNYFLMNFFISVIVDEHNNLIPVTFIFYILMYLLLFYNFKYLVGSNALKL